MRQLRTVRDKDVLARLPAEARGKVKVADLKAQGYPSFAPQQSFGYGINNKTMRELFEDGQPLTVARWPNSGTVMTGPVLDSTNHVFTFTSERLARWSQAKDVMANGYWYHLWAVCAVPLGVDTAARLDAQGRRAVGVRAERPLRLQPAGDRPARRVVHGQRNRQSVSGRTATLGSARSCFHVGTSPSSKRIRCATSSSRVDL